MRRGQGRELLRKLEFSFGLSLLSTPISPDASRNRWKVYLTGVVKVTCRVFLKTVTVTVSHSCAAASSTIPRSVDCFLLSSKENVLSSSRVFADPCTGPTFWHLTLGFSFKLFADLRFISFHFLLFHSVFQLPSLFSDPAQPGCNTRGFRKLRLGRGKLGETRIEPNRFVEIGDCSFV